VLQRSFWGAARLLAAVVIGASLASCGGSGGGADPGTPPPGVPAPVITQQPASQTVQEGSAVTFSVSVQTEATLTYQWLRNGAEVGSANSSSHLIPAAALADSGSRWAVRATNAGGSVLSGEAVLTVTAVPVPATPVGVSVFKAAEAGRADEMPIGVDQAGQLVTASVDASAPVLRKYGPDGQPRNFGDKASVVLAPATGGYLEPMSYAMDRDGVVYVAYTRFESQNFFGGAIHVARNCEVYRITPSGETTRILAAKDTDAGFIAVTSMATDSQGALYATDFKSKTAFKRGPDGNWTALGPAGLIQTLFATPAPAYLAVAPQGTVYMVDPIYRWVNKVGADGQPVLVAGIGRSKSPAIADGAGIDALFHSPSTAATDAAGNLYLTDRATIRRVAPDRVVTTVVGAGDDPLRVAFRTLPGATYGLAVDGAGVLYFGSVGTIWKARLQ
jgi:hypothetical protein